jgi:hypothetical protein
MRSTATARAGSAISRNPARRSPLPSRAAAAPLVEYAWGKGVLGTFRPGAVTLPAERRGGGLAIRLAGGALVAADPTASGGMRLTFTKTGQPPLVANLLPVGD